MSTSKWLSLSWVVWVLQNTIPSLHSPSVHPCHSCHWTYCCCYSFEDRLMTGSAVTLGNSRMSVAFTFPVWCSVSYASSSPWPASLPSLFSTIPCWAILLSLSFPHAASGTQYCVPVDLSLGLQILWQGTGHRVPSACETDCIYWTPQIPKGKPLIVHRNHIEK